MSKRAFIFPGQGSQSKGMLADLAAQHSSVLTVFARASNALGYDLWDVVQNDDTGKLNQTHITQPALLTASVAIFELLKEKGAEQPDFLAGHSLGEYSALVSAQVITLEDGVKLVESRGQYMQQAVPEGEGAMYAIIGLDDATIIDSCNRAATELGLVVSAVNFNSPGQVVIAGAKLAADKAAEYCKEAGAKRALPLAVSVPSHCALMQPAAEKLAVLMDTIDFRAPVIPVVNNVDVQSPIEISDIKNALVRQLYCPVRWTETVEYLAKQGVTNLYEIGPGKILSGLIKRIDKSLDVNAINSPDTISLVL